MMLGHMIQILIRCIIVNITKTFILYMLQRTAVNGEQTFVNNIAIQKHLMIITCPLMVFLCYILTALDKYLNVYFSLSSFKHHHYKVSKLKHKEDKL